MYYFLDSDEMPKISSNNNIVNMQKEFYITVSSFTGK